MPRDAISTLTGDSTDGTQTFVTGTQISTKRALDVNVQGTGGASSNLASRVDEASATVTYVGKAAIATAESAASWQIFRMEQVSTELEIKWADGNASFDNIWDNRASLSYS